jgi:hypothetical protein
MRFHYSDTEDLLYMSTNSRVTVFCVLSLSLAATLRAQQAVVVANPADIAKAMGIQTPFSLPMTCVNNLGPNNVCDATAKVPAGVRWVIKHISALCYSPVNTTVTLAWVQTTVGGALSVVYLNLPPSRFLNATKWFTSASQVTETYADPGSQVVLFANLSATAPTSQFACDLILQGQAISVP